MCVDHARGMRRVGSDFSGVGAFDMALKRFNIEHENVFSCDIDKYAKQTYLLNHKCNDYYNDVYTRPIPSDSLDIYMTSPPCQSFSLAGKREGENSDKGILFYNSLEFITKNKPKFFIFENVKGLISDNKGITFQNWCALLGGKSINGNANLFSYNDSVPYHIYWQVLNAKDYNIPQNRERVFIVGIRDDSDNKYQFPKKERLTRRLKDILEIDVDEKYYLSDRLISYFKKHKELHNEKGNGFEFKPKTENDVVANAISTKAGSRQTDNYILQLGRGFNKGGEKDIFPTITARAIEDGSGQPVIKIGAIRGRYPENPKSRVSGLLTTQMLEINENETFNTLTTVQKDNVVVTDRIRRLTPLECFRAMDFNTDFKWNVSDSQAYKQAGNSICVGVLAKIIQNLPL